MPSSDTLFRETVEFNPIIDIGSEAPPQLTKLISTSPNLKVYTRSSPHFQNLKAIWNLQYTTNEPLALIRATNTSDVSAAVKYCVSNKIQFTVRSGGHDLWGRSVVPDAVILDIRELNQIILAEDRKSVIMGGGAQTGPLVDFLDSKGLVTPCTLAGIVGHLGWAFMGGFGPLVNTFGLGVDQIIGAKIVTADGEVKEADSELLWGIKGAGGAFGVITEVTIKTYELPKLLGGMLMFQFDQAEKIIAGVKTMLETETIPTPLSLGFHFSKRGGVPVLSMMFSWVSTDVEEGRKWLHRIKNFGTVVTDMVGETTMKKWSDQMGPMLPQPSYNTSRSVFLNALTPAAVNILSSAALKIPEGVQFGIGTFFTFGEPTKPHPESSFFPRGPFVFLHALGPVLDSNRFEESREWTDGVYNELREAGCIKANYLAIMAPGMEVSKCFGEEGFERLGRLKRKVDPGNVFRFVPAELV